LAVASRRVHVINLSNPPSESQIVLSVIPVPYCIPIQRHEPTHAPSAPLGPYQFFIYALERLNVRRLWGYGLLQSAVSPFQVMQLPHVATSRSAYLARHS
jgi:hypothetical protein